MEWKLNLDRWRKQELAKRMETKAAMPQQNLGEHRRGQPEPLDQLASKVSLALSSFGQVTWADTCRSTVSNHAAIGACWSAAAPGAASNSC